MNSEESILKLVAWLISIKVLWISKREMLEKVVEVMFVIEFELVKMLMDKFARVELMSSTSEYRSESITVDLLNPPSISELMPTLDMLEF